MFNSIFSDICPVCGRFHDDGGMYEYKGKKFYLCMSCIENCNSSEVKNELEKRIKK